MHTPRKASAALVLTLLMAGGCAGESKTTPPSSPSPAASAAPAAGPAPGTAAVKGREVEAPASDVAPD